MYYAAHVCLAHRIGARRGACRHRAARLLLSWAARGVSRRLGGVRVRYEILSPTTGQSMTLQYADWLRLLGLDSRYGGIPDESLYHYYDEDGVAIPEDVAGDMAEALAGAERDLLALVQWGTLPGGRGAPP